ncbi:MAG: 3-phosphoshikimate 1-carboxyvinyltransferase [Buchananella hordeovulneris]|nr:3-phosphoshikimate 1-carboxyvinyltransferase [Buchananella hordeovulneris]MDO5081193.1 3-phosphoshikimate 1-carboxyvinyltransferase [Buchananella hordeovulneris]
MNAVTPATGAWSAPLATAALAAEVAVPGSKSLTARELVLSALATGPSRLHGALLARDTRLMLAALTQLGAHCAVSDGPVPTIDITPGPLRAGGHIDCGLAGTVMRFVPALAALAAGTTHFDGDPAARQRPLAPLLAALRQLGATVEAAAGDCLPVRVTSPGNLPGGPVEVEASASSQFLSALLLIGARLPAGLTIIAAGAITSRPHIDMTVQTLRQRGVQVRETDNTWQVAPGPLTGRAVQIEPDLSNAGVFLAPALSVGGQVRMANWPLVTTQAGDAWRELLPRLGASVELVPTSPTTGTLTVRGTGRITGIDVDLSAVGELAPTVAALATLATGPSRLRGIAHLRGHETDRLAALEAEITRLGATVRQLPDGLEITPGPLTGALLRAYDDHRMATFAAIVGTRVPGVRVDNIATTDKTLPDFVARWQRLLQGAA